MELLFKHMRGGLPTKKTLSLCIILVLITGAIWYFRPYSLSKLIGESEDIKITYTYLGVENGKAIIDTITFNEISDAQANKVEALLNQYSYRRKWTTFFSDGAMSDFGEHLLHIYVYDNGSIANTITVTASNECAINNKNHTIDNSEKLIMNILDIVKEETQ